MGDDQVLREMRTTKVRAKRVTKELRDHSEMLRDKAEVMQNPRADTLAKEFTRAEANVAKAKNVDQKLLDAQIFHKLGAFAKRQAALMQTGLKDYDVNSFVDKLALLMKQGQATDDDADLVLDLHGLGRDMGKLFASFPSAEFMYGNGDVQPREVKGRRTARRANKGAVAVKPTAMTEGDVPTTETDIQVAKMRKKLKELRRVNFWEFVVDPGSYVRSIENSFHASFLVKDGHAKLDLAADPPTITYKELRRGNEDAETAAANDREASAVNSQHIMRFDFTLWRSVCDKYKIERCMLPSQPVGTMGNGNGRTRRVDHGDDDDDDDGDDGGDADGGDGGDGGDAAAM
jgi:non-structural maintenance of chromosomes element 4